MTTPNNKYAALSRLYMERAEGYLRQEDFLQASEKSWGAAACALKSIAQQRGWGHQSHSLLYDVSGQIADEQGRPELRNLFAVAKSMHQNFYENWMPEDEVAHGVGRVKAYLTELESMSAQPATPFTIETRAQRRRLDRLTAKSEPMVDIPSE